MNQKTSRIRMKGVAGGLALLVIISPALALAAGKKKVLAKNVNLVWPLPPEQPRIKFLQAIYGAQDIEPVKKASFLDRVAGIEKKDFKRAFVKPYGIATDSHNRIYVTDSGQGLIFVLDPDNKQVTYLGAGGQVRLRLPLGITVDSQDRVWVADAVGQHVYAFDGEGNVLMALGRQDEMVNPTSVAVNETLHRLYVVDSKLHAILVYDCESGKFLSKIGQRGSEDGQFNFPTNVAVDREGRIYVADTLNFRIQIFDPEGKFLDTFGKQGNRFGEFLKPKGIALDNFHNLYVVDSDFDNFQIFDQKNRLLMYLGGGGQVPGRFWLPAGIHVDRNNRIYVAEQNNRRIQIFQLLSGETVEPTGQTVAKVTAPSQAAETKGGEPGVNKDSSSPQEKEQPQKANSTSKKENSTP